MKRIEANIRPEKLHDVIKAIRKVGVGGITVHDCKGQGTQEPPLVGEVSSRTLVTTIVEDNNLEDIMDAIANTCCTNSKGDGKIYVSDVVEMIDICTKEKETLDIPI